MESRSRRSINAVIGALAIVLPLHPSLAGTLALSGVEGLALSEVEGFHAFLTHDRRRLCAGQQCDELPRRR